MNGNIFPVVADVTSQESLAAAASIVRSKEGYVSAVIACAGAAFEYNDRLFPMRLLPGAVSVSEAQESLWSIPIENFTKTFNLNISGAFYTVVAFLDLLDAANKKFPAPHPKSQAIIVSSSAAFWRANVPYAYAASKAGAVHMTKQLSTTFAPYKIRFNCLCPGWFPTEMTHEAPFLKNSADPFVEGGIPAEVSPLERAGSAEDINGTILFMISRAGGYLSGSVQLTDGGTLSTIPASY